jgi:hypothetical protein
MVYGNNPNGVEEFDNTDYSYIKSIIPNPASGKTEIKYYLAGTGLTKIWITDIFGNRLFDIENKIMIPGDNSVHFNAGGLSDGVYFVLMQTPGNILKSKFVVIK